MINIVNNSFKALIEKQAERKLEIQLLNNQLSRIIINVINNGPLIPPGVVDKIFVPFFQSKRMDQV